VNLVLRQVAQHWLNEGNVLKEARGYQVHTHLRMLVSHLEVAGAAFGCHNLCLVAGLQHAPDSMILSPAEMLFKGGSTWMDSPPHWAAATFLCIFNLCSFVLASFLA
jgi:hypothetical protein